MRLGYNAGSNLTTGSNNIDIGNVGVAGESNVIRIGDGATQTAAFITGVVGVTTSQNNAVPVVIDSTGNLGTISSSRRYKEDIHDMGNASDRLQALRPVTFRYKKPYANGEKPIQYGLIAEEVAEVFPELAVKNVEGQPETVKYQDLTPMLLNEVQKLRAEKDKLRKESDDLREHLEETDAALKETNTALMAQTANLQRLQRTVTLIEREIPLRKSKGCATASLRHDQP